MKKGKKKNLKILDVSQKAELAMREAVADLIKEHRALGLPLSIWKNNKVALISANKIRLPAAIP